MSAPAERPRPRFLRFPARPVTPVGRPGPTAAGAAIRSAIIPGWGQWAVGRRRRGALLAAVGAVGALLPLAAALATVHPFLALLPLPIPERLQGALVATGAALAAVAQPFERLYSGADWATLGQALIALNVLAAVFRGWVCWDAGACSRAAGGSRPPAVGGRGARPFGRVGTVLGGAVAVSLVVLPHLGLAAAAAAVGSLLTPVLVTETRPLPALAQATAVPIPADPFAALLPQLPAVEGSRPVWDGKSALNVLLLGTDRRPQEVALQQWGNSDTILLVSVDPLRQQATMISIPRDVLVGNIPVVGQEKINAAYRRGGPDLAVRVVGEMLGVPIHRWASIDVAAFATIVDSVGGVIVDVERPIRDDEYPADDYAVRRIFIPAGLHWLDGERALWYARSRHGSTDFDRSDRQQRLLLSLKSRVRDPSILARLPSLMTSLAEAVQTDVSPREALTLASLGVKSDLRSVRGLVLTPPEYGREVVTPGLYAIVPDRNRIRRDVSALLTADPGTPAKTSVPPRVRSLPVLPVDADGDGMLDPAALEPTGAP